MITLGLDLGTSGMKALLLDGDVTVATATAPLTVQRPAAGWSEQHPEQWWQATERCLDQLAAEHPRVLAAVRGIGLSGQMHGATLLDAYDEVLRPCILWNDGRSAAHCAQLEAPGLELRRLAGNPAMAGFTAPKLRLAITATGCGSPNDLAKLSWTPGLLRLYGPSLST